jgi:tetratricopeptide (TPR) repeat protein
MIKDEVIPYLDRWPGLFFLFFSSNFILWIFVNSIFGLNLLSIQLRDLIMVEVGIFLVILVIWFLKRRLLVFDKREIGILIALTGIDPVTDAELLNLSKKLDANIIAEGFSGKVVIRHVPSRLIPKEEKEAHSLRKNYDAKLIIWGNVDRGNINNEPHTIFIPIFFSYSMRLPFDKLKSLNKNMTNLLGQHKWIISDRNNAIDRIYLAANIEGISLYIIGLTLFFAQKFDDAISLLSRVLKKYESKQVLSYNDRIAITNIQLVIFEIYKSRAKDLKLWSGSKKLEENIKQANTLTEEMQGLGFNASSLITGAQAAFAKKDFPKAKMLCNEALKYDYDDPAPLFSLAFLSYYNEELEDGYKYLKQAKEKNAFKIGDQLIIIARFYIEALNEDPTKIYLNFPLGIIYYDLIKDKILAVDCLQTFVDKYKEDKRKIVIKMLYQAEKRLEKNLRKQ